MDFPKSIRVISDPVKTIFLELRGQNFIALDVDAMGKIKSPCPWMGWTVINHETIDAGDTVKLADYSIADGENVLNKVDLIYPCLMVRNYGR